MQGCLFTCDIFYINLLILKYQTGRSWQAVQTQIRVWSLIGQSDQDLHSLQICQQLLEALLYGTNVVPI